MMQLHDDPLLHHREEIIGDVIQHQAGGEAGEHDGVDHRLGNRREILSDILLRFGDYNKALMAYSKPDPFLLDNERLRAFVIQLLKTEKRWCENFLRR
jgi:hypothetical protein